MYDEVQIRLTIGTDRSHWNIIPASASARPATISPFNFSPVGAALQPLPDHKPSSIVASVGTKLSVDHPPPLKRNGASRETG